MKYNGLQVDFRRRRRGSVYIAVIGASLIVSVIAFAAAHVAQMSVKSAVGQKDREQARLLALAAIEHAMTEFNTNPNWQTDYAWNTEYPLTPVSVNGGTFTWRLQDLGDGNRRLDGIGRVGDSEFVQSVNLGASSSECLQCALLAGGTVRVLDSGTILTVNAAPAASNGVFENFASVQGNVEAQTYSGSLPSGTLTSPGPVRALPDPSLVFDYYMSKGTVIPNAAIPVGGISSCVLSPLSNPYGATNPDGIYIINNPPIGFQIKRCRIVGTLVIRAPGQTITIKKDVIWEPARSNFPALLVEGDLEMVIEGNPLLESDISANLNPAGTPWQGNTDGDTADQYPSKIAGIIYSTNNILIDGSSSNFSTTVLGVMIANGNCTIQKTAGITITHDPTYESNPPPGFGSSDANSIVIGSWRQTPSQ